MLIDILLGRSGLAVSVEDDVPPEEAAARREEWRVSPEAGRWAARSRLLALVLIPLGAIGGAFLLSQNPFLASDDTWLGRYALGAVVGLLGGAALAAAVATAYRQTLLRVVTDRRVLRAAKIELDEAEQRVADSGDDDDLDLRAVWSATQRRLDYYHKIALSQSRSSFMVGQGAAIGGFVVLIAGAAVAALTSNDTGAIVAGTLGAVGAALSAFISATFARSQESATKQLRDYFSQPLHLSRVLTAERLTMQLPESQRGPATEVIVRAMFNGSLQP